MIEGSFGETERYCRGESACSANGLGVASKRDAPCQSWGIEPDVQDMVTVSLCSLFSPAYRYMTTASCQTSNSESY